VPRHCGYAIPMHRLLVRDDHAPEQARRALRELGDDIGQRQPDAELIISELVTNAVKHSDGPTEEPVELVLEAQGDSLRIEVCDAGNGFLRAAVQNRAPTDSGGWGFVIVEAIADAWGVRHNGKTCAWAVLHRG
jgi:serine/threonine-protein kinase RsbW